MSRKSSTAFTSLSALTAALGNFPNAKVRVGKEWARAMESANGISIPLESEGDEAPAVAAKSATKATATVS